MMNSTRMSATLGFTLLELLLVLALSSVLTTAVVRIFIGNRQNVQLSESYARIQESSRYALDYLARDFRMAGYLGCVNSTVGAKITDLLSPTDADYKPAIHAFDKPIRAIDNYNPANSVHVNAFNSITNTTIKPVAGTDVFESSSAVSTDLISTNVQASNTNNFSLGGPANQIDVLQTGLILMLTDCNTAHIFSVSNVVKPTTTTATVTHATAVNPGINNTTAFVGVNYPAGSQVLVMNTTLYYIGPSTVVPAKAGQPQVNSLYRVSTLNGGVPEELVPYVQDMQLLYSVDTNNDGAPDVYKTAAQIETDGDDYLASVYSVDISLIVSGNVDVNAPALAGFPDDGLLRKRYTRLVNIRNAGLGSY